MRVLCLSPFFPPNGDSESFCGGKMVLALRDQGADVTVFYMDSSNLFSMDDSPRWNRLRPGSFLINSIVGWSRLRSTLASLGFRTSAYARWIKPALARATELHRADAFDLIYSRSLPFFAHVAGYWISRQLRLPWIANVNDPWDLHLFPDNHARPASKLYRLASNYWLRKTLACADAVTFPCRRLALFTARVPSCRARVEVIPHVSAVSEVPQKHSGFSLLHAGKLGGNEISGRSPHALLKGLKRFFQSEPTAVDKVRLVLVGSSELDTQAAVKELDLRKAVVQTGRVSYEGSLEHIARASVCVLIEGEMQEGLYLPSKLVDYLGARKPVLALSPGIGTVRDMSTERSILAVEPRDEGGIAEAIQRLYCAYLEDDLASWAPSDSLVMKFRPDFVASRFLSFASHLSPWLEGALERREKILGLSATVAAATLCL